MAQDTDVLLKLHEEAVKQGLHHQSQRGSVTTLVFTICAGVLGFLTLDKVISLVDLPLALFLLVLGLFGTIFTAKQHERYSEYLFQAHEFRKGLEELLPTTALAARYQAAEARAQQKYPRLFKLRVWWLWVVLHIFIVIIGCVLSVLAITHVPSSAASP